MKDQDKRRSREIIHKIDQTDVKLTLQHDFLYGGEDEEQDKLTTKAGGRAHLQTAGNQGRHITPYCVLRDYVFSFIEGKLLSEEFILEFPRDCLLQYLKEDSVKDYLECLKVSSKEKLKDCFPLEQREIIYGALQKVEDDLKSLKGDDTSVDICMKIRDQIKRGNVLLYNRVLNEAIEVCITALNSMELINIENVTKVKNVEGGSPSHVKQQGAASRLRLGKDYDGGKFSIAEDMISLLDYKQDIIVSNSNKEPTSEKDEVLSDEVILENFYKVMRRHIKLVHDAYPVVKEKFKNQEEREKILKSFCNILLDESGYSNYAVHNFRTRKKFEEANEKDEKNNKNGIVNSIVLTRCFKDIDILKDFVVNEKNRLNLEEWDKEKAKEQYTEWKRDVDENWENMKLAFNAEELEFDGVVEGVRSFFEAAYPRPGSKNQRNQPKSFIDVNRLFSESSEGSLRNDYLELLGNAEYIAYRGSRGSNKYFPTSNFSKMSEEDAKKNVLHIMYNLTNIDVQVDVYDSKNNKKSLGRVREEDLLTGKQQKLTDTKDEKKWPIIEGLKKKLGGTFERNGQDWLTFFKEQRILGMPEDEVDKLDHYTNLIYEKIMDGLEISREGTLSLTENSKFNFKGHTIKLFKSLKEAAAVGLPDSSLLPSENPTKKSGPNRGEREDSQVVAQSATQSGRGRFRIIRPSRLKSAEGSPGGLSGKGIG